MISHPFSSLPEFNPYRVGAWSWVTQGSSFLATLGYMLTTLSGWSKGRSTSMWMKRSYMLATLSGWTKGGNAHLFTTPGLTEPFAA
jgi:hypothetical protein